MSSPGFLGSDESSDASDLDQVGVYEPTGNIGWEDDDDMEYEPASESVDESLGESDLDETEYYGKISICVLSFAGRSKRYPLTASRSRR